MQGSREDLLGDVCSGFDRSLLASSLPRTFNAAWREELEWLQTWKPRGRCSRELQSARPKSLDSKSTVPNVLEVTESQ